MKNNFDISTECRISGSTNLIDILYLGDQPLANSLKNSPADREIRVPLTLSFCPNSSLAQIRETVDKEILFTQYVWVSGTSSTTREYAEKLVKKIVSIGHLQPDDLVVEIASNDGTFLKPFIMSGLKRVIGIDPAKNITETANAQGINTITKFWDMQIAHDIGQKYGKAKVIIARNVIPHVSELHDVIAGVEHLLSEDGICVIEFHYVGNILDGLQYDSIYHEHLNYFSIYSLSLLLKQYNLIPFHAENSPISGGSIVIYLSKNKREQTKELVELLEIEERNKLNVIDTWKEFADRCKIHKHKSLKLISSYSDKTIVGFGSSARSSTYLNYCGITSNQVRCIIDNNPIKQGKCAPGSSIPIVSFEAGMEMNPDLIFILAWNFKNEIVQICKEAGYKGKYLISFPNWPAIVDC